MVNAPIFAGCGITWLDISCRKHTHAVQPNAELICKDYLSVLERSQHPDAVTDFLWRKVGQLVPTLTCQRLAAQKAQ